jgi:hypothetical protein
MDSFYKKRIDFQKLLSSKKLDLRSSQDAATAAQRKDTGFWLERQGNDFVRMTIYI